MNIEKYIDNGWSISHKGLIAILDVLSTINIKDYNTFNIVEFGSGESTKFFVDYISEYNLKNVFLTSFETESRFRPNLNHPNLKLITTSLMSCSDNDYNWMFENKLYDYNKMFYYSLPPTTRQKNCFYNITYSDLPNKINFVLLDGPNGNGRNLSFLLLKDKMDKNSIIFIDDYNHCDFEEKSKLFFNTIEIYRSNKDNIHSKKNDPFLILQIL
jgi:hypothetical protein